MTAKFVQMIRTQTGDAGTFHAGGIYEPNAETAGTLAKYVKRGFAERFTEAQLAAKHAAANPVATAKGKAAEDAKAAKAAEDAKAAKVAEDAKAAKVAEDAKAAGE